MKPYRDIDGYDALTDELAVLPDHERSHQRPSDFRSARAFIDFTDVARPLPPRAASPTHHVDTVSGSTHAAPAPPSPSHADACSQARENAS